MFSHEFLNKLVPVNNTSGLFKNEFHACKVCLVQTNKDAAMAGCTPNNKECIAHNAVKLFWRPGASKSECLAKCINTSAYKTALAELRAPFCKTCVKGMTQPVLQAQIKSNCPGKGGKLTFDDAKNCLDRLQKSLDAQSNKCTLYCDGGRPKPYYAKPPAEVSHLTGGDGNGSDGLRTANVVKNSGGVVASKNDTASTKSINDVALLSAIHSVYKRARRDEWKNFI